MPHSLADLTDFVGAARGNDPEVVALFSARFPKSKLHLPLTTLQGVKNRPQVVLEMGAQLPIHTIRLDNGEAAVPLFTNRNLCRLCADRLSWTTDGKPIKALKLPGEVALKFLREILVHPGFGRALLNPPGADSLHLARSDVERIASGQVLRSLALYSRGGRLKIPVALEGSSLLGSIFTKADRVLQNLTERSELEVQEVLDTTPILESSPDGGPLASLTSELFQLFSKERGEHQIRIRKERGQIRLEVEPPPRPTLLPRATAIAERHLSGRAGDVDLKLQITASAVTLSSTSPAPSPPPPPPVEPKEAPRPTSYSYIPLEPEED